MNVITGAVQKTGGPGAFKSQNKHLKVQQLTAAERSNQNQHPSTCNHGNTPS